MRWCADKKGMATMCACFAGTRRVADTGFTFSFPVAPSKQRVRLVVAAATDDGGAKSTKSDENSSPPAAAAPPKPSMKKGQIVRVDKEKYLNSINYLSVGHPTYYKGLDYIYEDRGEILDIRQFETGEYALIAWAGIPTSPAWLPTDMLIKSEKLSYRRT
ncbi:NAD(P)H-quinone oxidoreductase subunit O, chloroplastic-like [Selaginella moellendorffii]|uniref:NAD(P)H-quinone oxidoreductase subunit O, chloroplastic-like n=1 Tax=Selaginella moellendorffii TaxID=88036 RepID=UPI000D1CD0BB|nr:NAD(P)H-quinone oxidoreductase subunit O, chloroplastic-like [Selaginella moellendorffii]|eukprot:XP_024529704.1 NAD(P)H-quinone oxidoreductase subunit O, chloroplastic-like [Selaginella moellendorffii]